MIDEHDSEASTRRDIGVLVGPMNETEAHEFIRAFYRFGKPHRFGLQLQAWDPLDSGCGDAPPHGPTRPRDDGDEYPPGRGWKPLSKAERLFFFGVMCGLCSVLLLVLFLVLMWGVT